MSEPLSVQYPMCGRCGHDWHGLVCGVRGWRTNGAKCSCPTTLSGSAEADAALALRNAAILRWRTKFAAEERQLGTVVQLTRPPR